jgi:AcrR family transcriptional regulator
MVSRIKEVALQLFATKGYEGTTIREIGNQVGIKGSSIYSHFPSKEDIFISIVHDLFTKIMEEVEGINDINKINTINKDTDTKKLLFRIFRGFYRFFATHEMELLFWQRIRFFSHHLIKDKFAAYQLYFEKHIDEIFINIFKYGIEAKVLKSNNVELLTMAYHAFVSGYIDSLITIPFELSDVELQLSFDIFWNGISLK